MFAWLARIIFFRVGMRLLHWTWNKLQGESARGSTVPAARRPVRRMF
ncbi:MAG: hypothetical protein M3Z19_01800 [Chloroflexota bacterium]|nr:hypothetical protein [Chloroflexota bacterium]